MILAIDVGNTNVVLGCIEKGEIKNVVRIQTVTGETSSEYAIKIKQVLELYNIDPLGMQGAIISSVVPPVTEALREAVYAISGLNSIVVGPGIKTGMNIAIDDPGTLGADLLVGGVAAINYYGAPVIVIDMGTASTVSVIDGKKRIIGGAIVPGIKLSYAALAAGTSLLPDIYITAPEKAIASNTVDCMRSGAVYGNAAMMDGLIERMEEELGEKCSVVATGGLAKCIVPYCKREIIIDDDLLLKGLWILYEKNAKG